MTLESWMILFENRSWNAKNYLDLISPCLSLKDGNSGASYLGVVPQNMEIRVRHTWELFRKTPVVKQLFVFSGPWRKFTAQRQLMTVDQPSQWVGWRENLQVFPWFFHVFSMFFHGFSYVKSGGFFLPIHRSAGLHHVAPWGWRYARSSSQLRRGDAGGCLGISGCGPWYQNMQNQGKTEHFNSISTAKLLDK